MSRIDPRTDPKHRQSPSKRIGKWLTKQRVGLLLGPVLFLVFVAMPEPQAMIDAAAEKSVPEISPLIALGTLLWVLAWWVTECVPLGFALTYAASNTAAALITCPIAATLALGAGVSPVPSIVGAALACSISSAIPSTTPPMAIVYSSGYVKIWSMFKVGVVSDVVRVVALILVGYPILNLLY